MSQQAHNLVRIPAGPGFIEGMLELPAAARGLVLFAHGSGSSRLSPRNNYVAGELRKAGMATLLVDLLIAGEDERGALRFDIQLLTTRLVLVARHLDTDPALAALPLGVFGASTGAAAALQLAAALPDRIGAVVSRGGRPDLAGDDALPKVQAPTLLIVGGLDAGVIELNQAAYAALRCPKEVAIVPGATHLFEEPGTLEQVARLAADWFGRHLGGSQPGMAGAQPG
jgi:putative phosphoribosyl transferase